MQFENLRLVKQAFPGRNSYLQRDALKSLIGTGDWSLGERYGYSMVHDFNAGTMAWTDWNILLDENGGPNHV